ncbi:PDLI2 protein, partial [Polyodon spathula]|nr:PDLI2 protein [Polyodon spathula]
MSLNVNLIGPSPWGFRISGGRDFKKPIAVSKVTVNRGLHSVCLRWLSGFADTVIQTNILHIVHFVSFSASSSSCESVKLLSPLSTPSNCVFNNISVSEPASPGQTNGILTPERLSSQFQEALQVSRDENQNYSKPLHRSPCSPEPLAPRHSPGYSKPDTPPSARSFQSRSWSPVDKSFSPKVSLDSPRLQVREQQRGRGISSDETGQGRLGLLSPQHRQSPGLCAFAAWGLLLCIKDTPCESPWPIPCSHSRTPQRSTPLCLSALYSETVTPHSSLHLPDSATLCSAFTMGSVYETWVGFLFSDAAMHKFDRDSEVYKMIQENKESRTAPRQSSTFRLLQEVLESDEQAATVRFPGALSPSPQKAVGSVAGVTKFHICEKCDTSIVTQAVRIVEDRYRHPECYTCTQCGLNLKMRGHFWVGEEMFCEKHARERYQGPSGATPTTVHPKS